VIPRDKATPIRLESTRPQTPTTGSRIGYLLGSLFVLVVGLGVAALVAVGFVAACIALARALV
jgi:hypothetical protein